MSDYKHEVVVEW